MCARVRITPKSIKVRISLLLEMIDTTRSDWQTQAVFLFVRLLCVLSIQTIEYIDDGGRGVSNIT